MSTPCPKHMTYGPCGGVATDGTCEVGTAPCTFLEAPVVRWTGRRPEVSPPRAAPSAPAARLPVDLLATAAR